MLPLSLNGHLNAIQLQVQDGCKHGRHQTKPLYSGEGASKANLSDWSEDDEYGTLAIYGKYLTDTEGKNTIPCRKRCNPFWIKMQSLLTKDTIPSG